MKLTILAVIMLLASCHQENHDRPISYEIIYGKDSSWRSTRYIYKNEEDEVWLEQFFYSDDDSLGNLMWSSDMIKSN